MVEINDEKQAFQDHLEEQVGELEEIKGNISKAEADVEQLGDFLKGMRLRPIPLDIPNALTTTEWLMELTKSVNTILQGYNDYDEQTKTALEEMIAKIGDMTNFLKATYSSMLDRYASLDNQASNYEKNVTSLSGQYSDLLTRVNNLALSGIDGDEYVRKLDVLESTVNMWQSTIDTHSSNLETLENNLRDLQLQLRNDFVSTDMLDTKIAWLTNQIQNSVDLSENETVSSILTELDKVNYEKYPELKSLYTAMKNQVDFDKQELDRWKMQVDTNEGLNAKTRELASSLNSTQKAQGNMLQRLSIAEANLEGTVTRVNGLATLANNTANKVSEDIDSLKGTIWIKNDGQTSDGMCYQDFDHNTTIDFQVLPNTIEVPSNTHWLKFNQFFYDEAIPVCEKIYNLPMYNYGGGSEASNRCGTNATFFKLGQGYHTIKIAHYKYSSNGNLSAVHASEENNFKESIVRLNLTNDEMDKWIDYQLDNQYHMARPDYHNMVAETKMFPIAHFKSKPEVIFSTELVNVTSMPTDGDYDVYRFWNPKQDIDDNILYGFTIMDSATRGLCFTKILIDC